MKYLKLKTDTMIVVVRSLVILFFVGLIHVSVAQAPLVYLSNGSLRYNRYPNEGQSDTLNVIPDFSAAGYQKGGVALPQVEKAITLNPQLGDCSILIQNAINKVSAMPRDKYGFRGAVVLKKGVYVIDSTLHIRASGVVLRGEGNSPEGTVLICRLKKRHDVITIEGKHYDLKEVKNSRHRIAAKYVPTGATILEVDDAHDFKKGDSVVLQKKPNVVWIATLGMDQYGWAADDYNVSYERIITAVEGNRITINIPVVDPLDPKYGAAEIFKSRITGRTAQCGVENMRIESVFESDDDENHAWNAVVLKYTENCWVRDVVSKYIGYACVNVSRHSVFNTIQDCAMIDPKSLTTGGRKYSFNIEAGASGNLFQRCVSWGGRHDFVTGSKVPGPNVFLDCVAENTFADIGPHHRWATGTLFDNVYGGQIRVQNRKAMGSGHGWAGVQTLFWNCYSVKTDIKVESPVGARNWGIGCIGNTQAGQGYWESWGMHVTPRSLYLKQLEERLGPKAVKNIASSEQRNGIIWDKLKAWTAQLAAEKKVSISGF